jgi:hypothetical protein
MIEEVNGSGALEDTLLRLERRFWEVRPGRAAQLYREALVNEALLVLPAPAGVLDKADCIAVFDDTNASWSGYEIADARALELSDETALLTYSATAFREDDIAPYRALISSVYVLRDAKWLLAFHQQTPKPELPAAD